MKITSVRVNCDLDRNDSRKDNEHLIAFASIIFDGVFVVSHIRVTKNETGKVVVSMPSRQVRSGQYKDVAYPVTNGARFLIDSAIIAEIRKINAGLV